MLGVAPSRLRRWVEGYTYRYEPPKRQSSRRRRPPVVSRDLPVIEKAIALSFVELMELRVVRTLVDSGMSLQAVRTVAQLAAGYFAITHPLASRRLFTDGRNAFAAVHGDDREAPDLVELFRDEVEQIIAGKVFQPFLSEIEFNPTTAIAERWWPQGRSVPIVLDPRIAFGAPTVAGTGIRTSTLARMTAQSSAKDAAQAFELPAKTVEAATAFERQLQAA